MGNDDDDDNLRKWLQKIVGAKVPNTNQPLLVENKGCEARIIHKCHNWNSVMCQGLSHPKEDGTHHAMATMTQNSMKKLFLPSKNATIEHKSITTYIMGL